MKHQRKIYYQKAFSGALEFQLWKFPLPQCIERFNLTGTVALKVVVVFFFFCQTLVKLLVSVSLCLLLKGMEYMQK